MNLFRSICFGFSILIPIPSVAGRQPRDQDREKKEEPILIHVETNCAFDSFIFNVSGFCYSAVR